MVGVVCVAALCAVGPATSLISPARAAAQSGFQKFLADVTIEQAFQSALGRSPDDSEKRRYRVRIFEDHWSQRDIEDDLRGRRDYRSHDERARRPDQWHDRGNRYEVDRMIRHAYQDVLGREPDAEGLRTYRVNVMDRGWTERQVRDALRSSPEHRSDPHAREVVRRAYLSVLGREPDPASAPYVDRVLRDHWTEREVARELRDSEEYRNRR